MAAWVISFIRRPLPPLDNPWDEDGECLPNEPHNQQLIKVLSTHKQIRRPTNLNGSERTAFDSCPPSPEFGLLSERKLGTKNKKKEWKAVFALGHAECHWLMRAWIEINYKAPFVHNLATVFAALCGCRTAAVALLINIFVGATRCLINGTCWSWKSRQTLRCAVNNCRLVLPSPQLCAPLVKAAVLHPPPTVLPGFPLDCLDGGNILQFSV